jgi:hypothetical protein
MAFLGEGFGVNSACWRDQPMHSRSYMTNNIFRIVESEIITN